MCENEKIQLYPVPYLQNIKVISWYFRFDSWWCLFRGTENSYHWIWIGKLLALRWNKIKRISTSISVHVKKNNCSLQSFNYICLVAMVTWLAVRSRSTKLADFGCYVWLRSRSFYSQWMCRPGIPLIRTCVSSYRKLHHHTVPAKAWSNHHHYCYLSWFLNIDLYRGIIFISGGQCLWVAIIFLIRGDIISLVVSSG